VLTPTEDLERYLLELADLPVSQKITELWEAKDKARETALENAAKAPPVAPGGQPGAEAQAQPEDSDEPPSDDARALDWEIDDMKAKAFLDEFRAIARGMAPNQESALAVELRRANDLLAQSMTQAAAPAMPTIKFEHGNVELPEGFTGQAAAPVVNVDMAPIAAALEKFAEMMPAAPAPMPTIQVTNTVDTEPIAAALRQMPAPNITVDVPAQPAPIFNVPPAQVVAEVRMPETTETISVERDDRGLMTGATKVRRAKRS
jgi:hypothetical protein